MFKLLWRFLLLVLLAVGFAWLADRPGSVTIRWLGREIEMSVVVAVVVALAAIATLLFVWNLLRQLWRSPHAAREFWRFRKQRRGYEALSKGIIAAGAGDALAAARHAAHAGNALADEPLVNVLAAQAAQLKGDRANVRRIFEEMTKTPETEVMGLRGLFAEARGSGDLVAALKHAERALSLNPRLPWASSAVLQVQTARKSWEAAALTVEQQGRTGLMDREDAKRKRAALLAAQALHMEDSNRDEALSLATQAHALDASLVPAAAVIARCHIAAGNPRKAIKALRATWEKSPHPDLADLAARSHPGEGPEARFERVRDLVGNPQSNLEAAVALARAALAAQRIDVARDALSSHIAHQPQARVCALMAKVEDAAGDKGRAREWLSRALHAPRDPMWVSDGVVNTHWVPVSPVTGEIVRCEWKAPYEVLVAPDEPALPAETEAQPALARPQTTSGDALKTDALPPPPDDPGVPAETESENS